eukprot:5221432-Amphidinium_carterae.1
MASACGSAYCSAYSTSCSRASMNTPARTMVSMVVSIHLVWSQVTRVPEKRSDELVATQRPAMHAKKART